MSLNVVLGVGNKKLEKLIGNIAEINVLTVVKNRESLLDTISTYNPHMVIVSMGLSGKADYTELIPKLKNVAKDARIVFIYGETDTEFKYYADLLVTNGIYNFLVGELDEWELREGLLNERSFGDVEKYILSDTAKLEEKEKAKPQAPVYAAQETIIRETTIVRSLHNFLQIAVAGSVQKIGTSSTAAAIAAQLAGHGYSVALVEYNTHRYNAVYKGHEGIYSYFAMIDEYVSCANHSTYFAMKNLDIYPLNWSQIENVKTLTSIKGEGYDYIVIDAGVLFEKEFDVGEFVKSDLKIVVTGVKPHENDLSTLFSNTYKSISETVRFAVTFATDKQFNQFAKQLNNKSVNLQYMPNPFEPNNYVNELIADYLKEDIKEKKKKKRGMLQWLNKK